MRSRIIILSDLWGKVKSDWKQHYEELLNPEFDVQYYDCCELAGINTMDLDEASIHQRFIESGIDVATRRIIELERDKVSILAFSIGGTIAWKAGLEGLKIDNLYAISSTRLRYEVNKPNCTIKLHYGSKDNYIPNAMWLKSMNVPYEIVDDGDHLIYTKRDFAKMVCKEVKMQSCAANS